MINSVFFLVKKLYLLEFLFILLKKRPECFTVIKKITVTNKGAFLLILAIQD